MPTGNNTAPEMTSFRMGGAFGTANAILCNQIVNR